MENIQTYQLQMTNSRGGGRGKLPNANCDQTTKWKISKNYQQEMFKVNYQMQIVTKLPNENIQNYQLEMFDWGGGVNYQMQIVTKLPNGKYLK